MRLNDEHRQFLNRAITLARLGGKSVKTNPLVGCVIVHNNVIIGEGYHKAFGQPHAEINAINSVKSTELLPQSTMYVTLEPCNHQGKTPPCSNAIVSAGIRHVVIGCIDPTAKVNGAGIQHLRSKGVKVSLADDDTCKSLIQPFITNAKHQIPYVILKYAQSSDGYIGKSEEQVQLSSHDTNILVHKWRSEIDGIMIGTNTAVIDNPRLTTRLYPGDNPLRIVFDYKNRIPSDNHLLSDGLPTVVLTQGKNHTKGNLRYLSVAQPDNLLAILQELYNEGVYKLMVEGGAHTITQFVKAGLWNEARVITCQKTLSTGVKAPQITGALEHKINMQNDQVVQIRNLELKKF